MRLYYYRDSIGNFGDDLNPWLWSRLIPDLLDRDDSSLFIGIGTLLNQQIPAGPKKVVFGSGVGYGVAPVIDDRWKVYCVRGPFSAGKLGLSDDLAITDPGILVSSFAAPAGVDSRRISLVPHHVSVIRAKVQAVDLPSLCDDAGLSFIDPSGSVDDILQQIGSSDIVISEAMHGAIIADALRIPWIPVQLYDHIHEFKWWDWCKSLQLDYEPLIFAPSAAPDRRSELLRFFRAVIRGSRPVLSRREVAQTAKNRLQIRLNQLCADYRFSAPSHAIDQDRFPALSAERRYSLAEKRIKSMACPMTKASTWEHQLLRVAKEVEAIVPGGDTIILVDQDEWLTGGVLAGRPAFPFPERDGRYWGLPPDDAAAVAELERLRELGASFIFFGWPAFWWLEHYVGLHRHLQDNYSCPLENDRLICFDLRTRGEVPSMRTTHAAPRGFET